jgi:hypothetical protein
MRHNCKQDVVRRYDGRRRSGGADYLRSEETLLRGRPDGLALLGEVIERLRRVVPFEAYCASTKDPATGFITHGMAEETGGENDTFWSL